MGGWVLVKCTRSPGSAVPLALAVHAHHCSGGDSKTTALDRIVATLNEKGSVATKVPGPLLLATTGGRRQTPKVMPYSTSTAFAPTKELLTKAWQENLVEGVSMDVDLDLAAGKDPKWTTHSLRRLADTVARRYMELTGTTEDQIDIYFGWHGGSSVCVGPRDV